MKARLEPRINLHGRTPLETVIPLATPFVVFADPRALAISNAPSAPPATAT